ncbi:MAG: putative toxin-antitoxin system toxin component, PIN family [Patescibacteria group bacterium]
MKVVVDTNVLIDALNDNLSVTWKILELAHKGDVQFFASDKIVKEYKLIIRREVGKPKDKKTLERFIANVNIIRNTSHLRLISEDHEDDKFVNLALSAKAEYIISSDRHILDLREYENIKMVDPKDFYYLYKNQDDKDGSQEWVNLFGNIIK